MEEKSMFKSILSLILILFSVFFISETWAAKPPPPPPIVTCSFTDVTDVIFGDYEPLSGANKESNGSISVLCDDNVWITLSIGASPNSGGFNPRKMLNTTFGDLMNYFLYRNISKSEIWGDGSPGTYTIYQKLSRNQGRPFTVYGRIPGGQDVGVGEYGESLVITLEY